MALCALLIRPVISDCLTSFDPTVDYFPSKIDVGQAVSGFVVTYFNSYKVVTNTRAGENYVLYCTAAPPNVSDVVADVKGFFQVPVRNVASLDQTTLTFLEIIGAQSSLQYVEDEHSITSPCLQKDLAIQPFNDSDLANVDIVFSNSIVYNASKYVTVSLGDDLSPLSNANWVKFVSLFFNLEATANSAYSSMEAAYSCNANNVANVTDRKTIVWVAYDFNSGMFTIDTDNFYSSLVIDAGANSPDIISGSLNMSDLHEIINSAYIVIDQTNFTTGNDTFETWQSLFGYYATSTSSSVPDFITYRRVYHPKKLINTYGFDDWTERVRARPDLAILDLIAIQYPTYLTSYSTTWLDNFSQSDQPNVITMADCTTDNQTVLTCEPQQFTGGQTNNPTDKTGGNNKLQTKAILIIAFSVLAGLLGVTAGICLLVFARRRYEERFLELKDEPEVQKEKADENKV
ncbi:709_t:CDS:2 [Acaulospora colombiana]|uniref:709_t:CDS:1 n=1 Tax=Acaulospora colombiana TaxID=27376 RepID=A0ACA9KJT5_9GLOM|nr:709_t:CDS:2 [Acaulospora colombiana]